MTAPTPRAFFGPTVVRAAFVMAVFGWGVGFYGPPIFLNAVVQRTGWSLAVVSSAVTAHYLFGSIVITQLPRWHARFGVGRCAVAGAVLAALGALGWALSASVWQLFVAALASGAGWVTMGAVAVNAAIAPWYAQGRPMALAKAYNGASIGGVIFSPLWVALIAQFGFGVAAAAIGVAMVVTMALLASVALSRSPEQLGQIADGDDAAAQAHAAAVARERSAARATTAASPMAPAPLPSVRPWRDRRFATLSFGMTIGLFAQVGLLAHLYSLLVPIAGAQAAGWAMGMATACAIGGRLLAARLMPAGRDRREVAAMAYAIQCVGSVILACTAQPAWVLLGVLLFGSGIGNATSLPPLIAQAEFAKADVARVVALVVATGQAGYAFAPAAFGVLLSSGPVAALGGAPVFFAVVAAIQALAALGFLAGRRRAA